MRSRWRRGISRLSSRPARTRSMRPAAVSQETSSCSMRDYCPHMPITWTGTPEADRLLETDALALLIGLVLDQQVKMEKAFIGPYDLKQRLGHLDAGRIATMEPEKLD